MLGAFVCLSAGQLLSIYYITANDVPGILNTKTQWPTQGACETGAVLSGPPSEEMDRHRGSNSFKVITELMRSKAA